MGSMYTVSFTGVTVTAQQDFFELTAASGKPLVVHMIELSQSSDVGDAAEEGLSILIRRLTSASTSGSGGNTPNAIALNPSSATASMSIEVNNTTKASGGTSVVLHSTNWNVRVPYLYIPPPECRPQVQGGGRITVELATTPADSLTVSGTIYVEEIG